MAAPDILLHIVAALLTHSLLREFTRIFFHLFEYISQFDRIFVVGISRWALKDKPKDLIGHRKKDKTHFAVVASYIFNFAGQFRNFILDRLLLEAGQEVFLEHSTFVSS